MNYNDRKLEAAKKLAETTQEHEWDNMSNHRQEYYLALAELCLEMMANEVQNVWDSKQYLRGAKHYIKSRGLKQ